MNAADAIVALAKIRKTPGDAVVDRANALSIVNSVHPADAAVDRAFAEAITAVEALPRSRK